LATEELLERWKGSITAPGPNPFLETTKVVDKEGRVLGFNVYLVWGEVFAFGHTDLKTEVEG
jgi:hypothetical protein